MNAYLILARCGFDDIPLRLCASHAEAQAIAQAITSANVRKTARDIFGLDTTDIIGLDIVRFSQGEPVSCTDVEHPEFAESSELRVFNPTSEAT